MIPTFFLYEFETVQEIIDALTCFERNFGLKLNYDKSIVHLLKIRMPSSIHLKC